MITFSCMIITISSFIQRFYFAVKQISDYEGGIGVSEKPQNRRKKIILNRTTAKKLVQNRKPHTKRSKADKMVIREAYKANYANSYFMKVFVNVMDFSETLVYF